MIKMSEEQKSLWERTSIECWNNWKFTKKSICLDIIGFSYDNDTYRKNKCFYFHIMNFVITIKIEEKNNNLYTENYILKDNSIYIVSSITYIYKNKTLIKRKNK